MAPMRHIGELFLKHLNYVSYQMTCRYDDAAFSSFVNVR
jgi:hypothetical protein